MIRYDPQEYPLTLIGKILSERHVAPLTPDQEAGLEYALKCLEDERAQKVLELRFKEGLSRPQVGAAFGLASKDIRQIEEHATRRLRHPSRAGYILFGLNGYRERKAESERKREEVRSIQDLWDETWNKARCMAIMAAPDSSLKEFVSELEEIAAQMSKVVSREDYPFYRFSVPQSPLPEHYVQELEQLLPMRPNAANIERVMRDEAWKVSIYSLGLTAWTINFLSWKGICSLGEILLMRDEELLAIPSIGAGRLKEIREKAS